MSALSDRDLVILRQYPQGPTGRYVSVCSRLPVFEAEITAYSTDSDTKGVYAFTFENVTLGAYTNVLPGLTVDFYDTSFLTGERVYAGSARVRKAATSTTCYIGESAAGDCGIQNAQVAVVVNERRLWQRLPLLRTTKSASTVDYYDSFAAYKDYDLAYSDENLYHRPLANITGEPAGWCDTGLRVRSVRLDGSGSVSPQTGGWITAYAWNIEDCTLKAGYALTDAVIELLAPAGFRYIALTVTDNHSKTSTHWFPIWAHDAAYPPLVPVAISDEADRQSGREMEFTFVGEHGSYDETRLPKGTQICYWKTARFGDDDPPIPYRRHFIGWATQEAVKVQAGAGEFRLTAAGPAWWLDHIDGYQDLFLLRSTPTAWYHMADITDDRVILHLLRYNTTALDLINVYLSGVTDPWGQAANSDYGAIKAQKASVWQQITVLANEYCGWPTCRSDGSLQLAKHLSLREVYSTPGRADAETVVELGPADWRWEEALEVTTRLVPQVGQVEMDGVSFAAGVNTFYRVRAPGKTPGWVPGKETAPVQVLSSTFSTAWHQLLWRGGHWLAMLNTPLGDVTIVLLGDFDILDPSYAEPITLTASADNPRGLELEEKQFLVKHISIQHSTELGTPAEQITWTLEAVTSGTEGEMIPIETQTTMPTDYMPPEDVYPGSSTGGNASGGGGYGDGKGHAALVLAVHTAPSPQERKASICLTTDSLTSPVDWTTRHAGLPAHPDGHSGVVQPIYATNLDPWNPDTWIIAGEMGVYYNADWKNGGGWTAVATLTQLRAAVEAKNGSGTATTWRPSAMALTPAQSGLIYVVGVHENFDSSVASVVRIQNYQSATPTLTASYSLKMNDGTNHTPGFAGPLEGNFWIGGGIAVSVSDPDFILVAAHLGSEHPFDAARWGVWGGSFNTPYPLVGSQWLQRWKINDSVSPAGAWYGVAAYIPLFKTNGDFNEHNDEFFVAAEGKIWRCTTSALTSWSEWSTTGPRVDASNDKMGARTDMIENSHAGLPFYFLRSESEADTQTSMYIGDPSGGWTEVPLPTAIPMVGWQGGWPAVNSQYYIGAQAVNWEYLTARSSPLLMMTEDQWATSADLTGNLWSRIPSTPAWRAGVIRLTPHWRE